MARPTARPKPALALAILVVLAAQSATAAMPGTCTTSGLIQRTVKVGVLKALADYQACVSEYYGRSVCTRDFAILVSAQRQFEVAVAEKSVQCTQ